MWRPFLYSSVYSCHLFLIFSAFVRSLLFLSFFMPILAEIFPWYLQFSWRDLYSFLFCCFPLFVSIVHLRRPSYHSLLFSETLHSVGYIFPFLSYLLLLFFPLLFVSPPQTTTNAFLHFFFFGMGLVMASGTMLWTSVHSFSVIDPCARSQEVKFAGSVHEN